MIFKISRFLSACCVLIFLLGSAAAQNKPQGISQDEDPFAKSQLSDIGMSGGTQLSVRGFVDTGFINITQTGPMADGGDISWVFGNSQFTFFSQTSTFAINEVDITFDVEKEIESFVLGGRFSIDFYPSRDSEAYTIADSEREFDVDQAFVFLEFTNFWNTRIVLGRAPGFVTLEQEEADSPDLRLIGHTYVFQAGGGYPIGLQVITRPSPKYTIKVGFSNGGVGDYSFFPGDDSTTNRPVARDADNNSPNDQVDKLTFSLGFEWVPFDRPADIGTLKIGIATAQNPGLTFNPTTNQPEPYSFNNIYFSYRPGSFEVRGEIAALEAFYELSLGKFDATMYYLLLTFFIEANHQVTIRGEGINFTTHRGSAIEGKATKNGISYRYRFHDSMVLKVEAVREVQTPQFFLPGLGEELTTDVFTTSWVFSF